MVERVELVLSERALILESRVSETLLMLDWTTSSMCLLMSAGMSEWGNFGEIRMCLLEFEDVGRMAGVLP